MTNKKKSDIKEKGGRRLLLIFERKCEYGFTENEDYIALFQKRKTAQGNETTYTDHQLTLDMAKQICMIQRTDEGRRYREYFLEVERQWNDPQDELPESIREISRRIYRGNFNEVENLGAKNTNTPTNVLEASHGTSAKTQI